MLMLGGALIEKFKPILDEFKRWRVLLEVPYKAQKDRCGTSTLDRSRCQPLTFCNTLSLLRGVSRMRLAA